MPTSASHDALPLPPESAPTAPPPIRWQIWPLRDRRLWSAIPILGLVAAGAVVFRQSGRWYLALLAMAALAASLWRFFVPVVFELGDEGVGQWLFGRHRRIPWHAIGVCEVCAAGVLLLPHKDRSALSPLRGLYVPWGLHRDEVLALVQHYLGEPSGDRTELEPGSCRP